MKVFVRTINIKWQVTLPAEIRKILGVKPGDEVVFKIEDDKITLSPV